jgi:hypothetical protein
MSDTPLRPCPFCGESKRLLVYSTYVTCLKCGADGPFDCQDYGWNSRTPDYEKKWAELVETVGQRIAQAQDEEEK